MRRPMAKSRRSGITTRASERVLLSAPALGHAFTKDGLAAVIEPIQLWRAEDDQRFAKSVERRHHQGARCPTRRRTIWCR